MGGQRRLAARRLRILWRHLSPARPAWRKIRLHTLDSEYGIHPNRSGRLLRARLWTVYLGHVKSSSLDRLPAVGKLIDHSSQ